MRKAKPYLGHTFGRLTITGIAAMPYADKEPKAVGLCSCGARVEVRLYSLTKGRTKSGGCLQKELARQLGYASARHGQSNKTKEYDCWINARQRCNNPNNTDYKNYGSRGIKFLFNSFEEFYAELGDRPPGLSLDRKDVNGHYEKGNVRWATSKEQAQNKRCSAN